MIEWKAKRKRPGLWDRASEAAFRRYGEGSHRFPLRDSYRAGYIAGWRAAKREKRR